MSAKEGTLIFVTVGVPFTSFPIMQKVMVYVEPTTDTPVTAAKELRKWVGENLHKFGFTPGENFKPEDLYYEIYAAPQNNVPFAMSFNSPYRKKYVDGLTVSLVDA